MPKARFYTVEQIGNKQGVTPEGFLICYDVVAARTGEQLYAADEVPIEAGPDGLVRVDRPPEEVFRPETIASFNGKLVVVEHPVDGDGPVDVNPENWKDFSVGSLHNPRQGLGVEDDVMLVDVVIYDPDAIELVRTKRKTQVSCGYDAEYEDLGNGRGVQRNIVGNHLALVDAGRCGPLCSVRDDNRRVKGVTAMTAMTDMRSTIRDLLFRASRVKDAEELNDLEKEAGKRISDAVQTGTPSGNTGEPGSTVEGESLHIHLHQPGGEGSAGAGGSAGTGDDDPMAGAGGGGGGEDRLAALEKAVTDLTSVVDMICKALGVGEGGEGAPGGEGGDGAPMPHELMSNPEGDGTLNIQHAADDGGEERFDPQENKKIKVGGFGAEAPPGAAGSANQGSRDRRRGRDAMMARDSSGLSDTWQDTMAMAEILSPGVRMPTFDHTARAITTLDRMCKFRRRVLNTIYDTDMDMHNVLDNLVDSQNGYSPSATMTCDAVSHLFRAAAQVKRDRNNMTMGRDTGTSGGGYGATNRGFRASDPHAEATGIAVLNQRNREAADKIWGTGSV
jgi:uncharacterized protein